MVLCLFDLFCLTCINRRRLSARNSISIAVYLGKRRTIITQLICISIRSGKGIVIIRSIRHTVRIGVLHATCTCLCRCHIIIICILLNNRRFYGTILCRIGILCVAIIIFLASGAPYMTISVRIGTVIILSIDGAISVRIRYHFANIRNLTILIFIAVNGISKTILVSLCINISIRIHQ